MRVVLHIVTRANEAVEAIARGRINFSERTLLDVRIVVAGRETKKLVGLNDAVFSRGELSRLIRLRYGESRFLERRQNFSRSGTRVLRRANRSANHQPVRAGMDGFFG